MINHYLILNRKPSFIIKTFILVISFIIIAVIWGVNTFYYQNFIILHSRIKYFDNSYYFIEVLVPIKEVKQITNQNQIAINNKTYNYLIYKIDNNITYIDDENYQYVYLKVINLDDSYLINGYETDVKILKERKKIIDYLRE